MDSLRRGAVHFGQAARTHVQLGSIYSDPPSVERGTILDRTMELLSIAPITIRCTELTQLIQTAHLVELRGVYPTILQHVFGWRSALGWRLPSVQRELSPVEIEAMMRFLRADGPLVELSYRLMGDPSLVYDFPLAALPMPLQRKIRSGDTPSFIASKLWDRMYNSPSYSAGNLILNPFELFFFHYAYSEIRPGLEPSPLPQAGTSSFSNTIYSDLLIDYLNYFVPVGERKTLPPLPNMVYQRESPSYKIPPPPPPARHNNNVAVTQDFDLPTLFKASIFQNEVLSREPSSVSTERNPSLDSECWRTETFLNILISMWLSFDEIEASYQFESVLPSVELVKSIRVIVRHLHQFIDTVNGTVQHPLEEVKRNVFPVFQKRLYLFLRHIFPRWPLDNSFRIVYETWLSYIQPWRYSDSEINRRAVYAAHVDGSLPTFSLDANQCNFVLENLLFYTSLFQQILPRLSRADLTCIRNTHMLYRITKVYAGIENLKGVLYEIEKSILLEPTVPTRSLQSQPPGGNQSLPFLESSSFFPGTPSPSALSRSFAPSFTTAESLPPRDFVPSSLKLANVKQLIRDYEGQEVNYTPLFSEANREKVAELVEIIGKVLIWAAEPPQRGAIDEPEPQAPSSLLSWVYRGLRLGPADPGSDRTGPEYDAQMERGRLTQFLNMSRSHLVKLFNLPPRLDGTIGFGSSLGMHHDTLEASTVDEDVNMDDANGVPVVPRGSVLRRYMEVNGDPDTRPVGSDEFKVVVSATLWLNKLLNRWVCPWAEEVYFEDSWRSRICRAVCARPIHYHDIRKWAPFKTIRLKKYLPPRLNLRFLASTTLPYIGITFGLLCWFFRVSGVYRILLPLTLIVLFILLRAFFEPADFLAQVRHDFSEEIQRSERRRRGPRRRDSSERGGAGDPDSRLN